MEPKESYEGAPVIALDVLLEVDEVARVVTSASSVADVLAAIAEGANIVTIVFLLNHSPTGRHHEPMSVPPDVSTCWRDCRPMCELFVRVVRQ